MTRTPPDTTRCRPLRDPEAEEELRKLAAAGLVTPEAVLRKAKSSANPLHKHFNWDDTEAARLYRLEQARGLIVRYYVKLKPANGETITVRGLVSLGTDRINGGGYRPIGQVLSDKEMRRELIKTALAELIALQKRYDHLKELAAVWEAIDKQRKKNR